MRGPGNGSCNISGFWYTKGRGDLVSKTRKHYIWRLAGRILVLLACTALLVLRPEEFAVLEGMNFFRSLSPLHLLWAIWVGDMVLQIIPIKNKVPLGSQKLFLNRFRPIWERVNYEALRAYVISTTKASYRVFILWCALIMALGALFYNGRLTRQGLFMISVFFMCATSSACWCGAPSA